MDLTHHKQSRAEKDAYMGSLADELRGAIGRVGDLERRIAQSEDTAKKLRTAIAVEKSAREGLEKTIASVLEDRMNRLHNDIEELRRKAESDADGLRKRAKAAEDVTLSLRSQLEALNRGLLDVSLIVRESHSVTLSNVQKEIADERVRRTEEFEKVRGEIASRILALKNEVEADRLRHARENEATEQRLKSIVDDAKEAVMKTAREAETALGKLSGKHDDAIRDALAQLEKEKRARESAVSDSSTKSERLLMSLRADTARESRAKEEAIAAQIREVGDRLWTVSQVLSAETSSREAALRSVMTSLEEEKKQREDETEVLTRLVEASLHRIRGGLEIAGRGTEEDGMGEEKEGM